MHQGQILDMINVGIVVLDRDLIVRQWNRWMVQQSGIAADTIIGSYLFDHFPTLDTPKFHRGCKAVFRFGSFSFFSQKLHGHLFPFSPAGHLRTEFDHMQQSCTLGPLYDEDRRVDHLFISVEDVTDAVLVQNQLTELNRRDPLTGLYNRRHLADQLAIEFERARRYRRPLTLMMLDIDEFKDVNDRWGHPFGDEVIRVVAKVLVQELRAVDFAARYGGEEFCCFLPETSVQSASVVAERIRQRIVDMKVNHPEATVSVTVSVGIAERDADVADADSLLRLADDALYQAKSGGRNRVCMKK